MVHREIETRVVIGVPQSCPLGRISVAGFIRRSPGIPLRNMRVLGSHALVYLIEGHGRYADAAGRNREVSAGDLLLLGPELAHGYGPADGGRWDEFYAVFDGPVFDVWRRGGLLDRSGPVHRLEPVEYGLRRLEGVVAGGVEESDVVGRICRLQSFLAEVVASSRASGMDEFDRQWLERAKARLSAGMGGRERDGEPSESVESVESVGESMGLSYAGFRKRFSRLAGVPPARFRMRGLIDRACGLLHEGWEVKRVARACGFCDEFHFSRRFKQVVGLSPRAFRRSVI